MAIYMKKTEAVPGGIVLSTQGRDEGRYYLIKEVLPDGYIYVCDGNYKKLASPKKKSLKHKKIILLQLCSNIKPNSRKNLKFRKTTL